MDHLRVRNTMSQERLTRLALMYIHQNINVDTNRVINEFDATGHRRIVRVSIMIKTGMSPLTTNYEDLDLGKKNLRNL